MKPILVSLASALLFVGCASVSVVPVANKFGSEGTDDDKPGVHFYRSAPHVWITLAPPSDKVNIQTAVTGTAPATTTTVTSLAGKSYTATLVYLPDYSQEYKIKWTAGTGNVSPGFKLEQGWNLVDFNSRVESKFSENLTALTSTAGLLMGGALTIGGNFAGAGLYKLVPDANGALTLGPRIIPLE